MSAKNMYSETTSILRLPDSLQEKVDEALEKGDNSIRLEVDPYDPDMDKDRTARFYFQGKVYLGLVKFLPRVVEAYKRTSNQLYNKSTDIAQIIEIFENEEEYERNRGSMYHEDGLTKPTMSALKSLNVAKDSLNYNRDLVRNMEAQIYSKSNPFDNLRVSFEELVPDTYPNKKEGAEWTTEPYNWTKEKEKKDEDEKKETKEAKKNLKDN